MGIALFILYIVMIVTTKGFIDKMYVIVGYPVICCIGYKLLFSK